MTSNTRFGLVVVAAFSGGVFGAWLFAPHTADAAATPQAATGPQSASGQPTASQAITATANLPTIINVPPQGLIFRGSSGRTLARIDEVQNGANFDGKLTLPETDGAGKEVAGKKGTLTYGRLSLEASADSKSDLSLAGLTLKGKGYGGIPANVSAPSTATLTSGSMMLDADGNKTILGVNYVSARTASAAKMFTSAGVATPPF